MADILKKLGFEVVRQRGSHLQFRDAKGRCTRVPPTKGAISHRRSCARSLRTSASRPGSPSARKLSSVLQGAGQQVIHHKLCRQDRGGWNFSTVAGAFGRFATRPAHTHRIPRPFLAPRKGLGHAPSGGVGFSAVIKLASRASPSRRQQQVLLSRPNPSAVLHPRPARPWFAPLPAAEQASLQFPICGASSPVPCSITCFRTRSSTWITDLKSGSTPWPDNPAAAAPTCVAAPDGRGRASR